MGSLFFAESPSYEKSNQVPILRIRIKRKEEIKKKANTLYLKNQSVGNV